jgi:D-glycero-D-manno-heptose 1,7-bisphosphate phosphatase
MLTTNIILMAGLPASGKSQFVQKYKDLGYVILSLDAKTMSYASDTATLEREINKGNKVVIDNTNTVASNRKVFIDFAKRNNLTIGIHHMNTSKEDCLINSLHRMYKRHGQVFMHSSDIPSGIKSEPNNFVISAIFSMVKNFDKINKSEGFDQVEVTKFERQENWGYTNKAVFIDLDGTVRESTGLEKYPLEIKDISILKNSSEVLKKYKASGYKIIAITNQSGVSKKVLTSQKVVELIEHTNKLLDNVIDDYYFCPHLPPKDVCYCRKPQSGMGVLMMHKHQLDLKQCIMIGDSTSDKTFADRLGIKFFNPTLFFDR